MEHYRKQRLRKIVGRFGIYVWVSLEKCHQGPARWRCWVVQLLCHGRDLDLREASELQCLPVSLEKPVWIGEVLVMTKGMKKQGGRREGRKETQGLQSLAGSCSGTDWVLVYLWSRPQPSDRCDRCCLQTRGDLSGVTPPTQPVEQWSQDAHRAGWIWSLLASPWTKQLASNNCSPPIDLGPLRRKAKSCQLFEFEGEARHMGYSC